MQVWTKLTLGFALTTITIVGGYGIYQLRQEERNLRDAARHHMGLIGAALQVAMENAIRDLQPMDVQEIVDVVKRWDPSVDVLVFDAAGLITAGSSDSTPKEDVVRDLVLDAQSAGQASVRFEDPQGLSHVIGAFPILGEDGLAMGTLAVVRPLDASLQDLRSEAGVTVLTLLTLTVGLVGAGWLLAFVYVRRPIRALVAAMRAVRSGDLSAQAAPCGADEIGAAAGEFNALVADLADARRRLLEAVEARQATEASLQRADKLVTVGQLAAELAHEIGSPLQILHGRARTLAARPDLPADVQRTGEILANESDRITRIVDQLLTLSRRSAPCMTDVELRVPVSDIVELFGGEARRHDVRLELECDDSLPTVTVDVSQIQQVVMNLLSNAVRASKRGGCVRVVLGASSFAVEGGEPRPSVSLVVEDTGEGIPEALLPHIFEPFFTTRAETGGTGLGLAVVKSIVDSHGGAIAVTTRGERTRFTVQFPVSHRILVGKAAGS